MPISEQKQWAKEFYKGVENSLKPSFSPDYKTLDEMGIRHDVRQSIKHGFFSSMCSSVATTLSEKKSFLEICCEESQGKILIGANVNLPKLENIIELLIHAEKVGCSHAFLGLPRKFSPDSEEDVYNYYRQIADSTKLPITLYGCASPALRRFHPSGILIDVFDRLADVPNFVAMKLTQPINLSLAFQLCERLSDRLLIAPAHLDLVPIIAKHYNVQWLGEWVVESVQSPEKPYLVEFMDLLNKRQFDQAMKIYWQMEPAYRYLYELQESFLLRGSHPWAHIKYYHWCVGGNGGLIREMKEHSDQSAMLDAPGRQKIRDLYRKIGISPVEAIEEEFVVGKANYARGVRLNELSETPLYLQ